MRLIDRRKFILSAASVISLPFLKPSDAKAASSPSFRFVLPDNENTFAVGENVPLRIFTKTQYPRLRVNFKANGQLIGTAASFPYLINWTPAQIGNYDLTAEISTPRTSAVIGTNVKVFNLLYDGIGRRGNRLFNVEDYYESYQSVTIPEASGFGFPMNYLGSNNIGRTIQRIEIVASATTRIFNDWRDIPFPNFRSVAARFWNDGATGFRNSPLNGNLGNFELGAPNFGSTTVPLASNSVGIKYYLTGWTNLNIPLPASASTAMSLQCSINSGYDFTERINIARSSIAVQNLLYVRRQYPSNANSFTNIGTTAVRIWTD